MSRMNEKTLPTGTGDHWEDPVSEYHRPPYEVEREFNFHAPPKSTCPATAVVFFALPQGETEEVRYESVVSNSPQLVDLRSAPPKTQSRGS